MYISQSIRTIAVSCVSMVLIGCQQERYESPVRLDRQVRLENLEQLAPTAARKDADKPVLWYDATQLPVEGKGWTDTEKFFQRLPAKAKGMVPDPVWVRGQYSTGLCVRFATDSSDIHVKWAVSAATALAMNHMPASSVSGVDLYVRHDGRWCWIGLGPPDKASNEMIVARGLPAEPREYALYLPLYNNTESLEIGIDANATLSKAPPRSADRSAPIVFYGTSITHGGCCSRPGMTYPAILGRRFDRPTINLGFSGSGKMEPELADLLAELDAAAYVLDCLPNMEAEMVTQRVEPFVKRLRAARPGTPIVLVENITYQNAYLVAATRSRAVESNRALELAYDRLKKDGVRGLYYLPGDHLLGDDHEATVDGTHPTDLGFIRIAAALEPVVREALRSLRP